jgi:ribosomal protein S20
LATHKSAEKRSRQNEKRQLRNASVKSQVKTKIKSVIMAVETKDKAGSETALAKDSFTKDIEINQKDKCPPGIVFLLKGHPMFAGKMGIVPESTLSKAGHH